MWKYKKKTGNNDYEICYSEKSGLGYCPICSDIDKCQIDDCSLKVYDNNFCYRHNSTLCSYNHDEFETFFLENVVKMQYGVEQGIVNFIKRNVKVKTAQKELLYMKINVIHVFKKIHAHTRRYIIVKGKKRKEIFVLLIDKLLKLK